MEITFTISDETAKQLSRRAGKEGQNVSTFMAKIAEREAKKPTLDEVLAPVRRQFAESGMNENELTELVREERKAIQKEKRGEK